LNLFKSPGAIEPILGPRLQEQAKKAEQAKKGIDTLDLASAAKMSTAVFGSGKDQVSLTSHLFGSGVGVNEGLT